MMATDRRIYLLVQLMITQGICLLAQGLRAPVIKPFNFAGQLSEGLRTGVMCMVTDGDPPFNFEWSKDGRPLNTVHKGVSIQKMNDFTSFLTIEKLDADSNGNYTCRVSNTQGHDHKSDTLSMRGLKAPKIKPFHFSDDLEMGLRSVVVCAVMDGDPPFNFEWSKDGRPLATDHKGVTIRKMDDFTSFLTIEKLDADSNGNYTCRVSNSQGYDHKSDTLSMRGLKTPKIKPFHFSGELGEGMRTGVMCMVLEGDPPLNFEWSKDGRPLNTDHKDISIRKIDEFTSILNIEKLDADSNGNYTCRVSNAQGYDHKSDTLSMRGLKAPKIKPFHFSDDLEEGLRTAVMCVVAGALRGPKIKPFHFSDDLEEGLRTAVTCVVQGGDPPFDFEWSKDEEEMMSNERRCFLQLLLFLGFCLLSYGEYCT
ncbi:hypothetical protein JTE90_026181 [Oedothorax gibbosus]|uniref:Ig-like domain-containing protein n=1 Tax=Oedothorax gibbosus TaxID=931172 RepID=A0AAV6UE99_9ARAC|nr:hypothetical protein JTE90_026181 [Oedothorax gibbosus]